MNRIWLEIDKPRDDEHAREMVVEANRMLARLGNGALGTDKGSHFAWHAKRGMYVYEEPSGTYEDLPDRGRWFNLSFFGREVQA